MPSPTLPSKVVVENLEVEEAEIPAPKRPMPLTLSTPAMVDEPVTESALVVAEVRETKPPFTAFRIPPMVEEEVTERRVVVAEIVEIPAKREVEEAKIPIRAQSAVEVAEVEVPKFVSAVKSKAPATEA